MTDTVGVVPEGCLLGCLPRTTEYGQVFTPAKEKVKIIPESKWSELLSQKRSLRPFVKQINYQKNNSCASEASNKDFELVMALAGLPHILFNPLFTYHHVAGGRDAGSGIDENLDAIIKYGCCPESVYSRSEGWKGTPPQKAYDVASFFRDIEVVDIGSEEEMVSCYLNGYGIVRGSKSHATLIVEITPDKEIIIANSWDYSWGDQGFGVWDTYNQAVNGIRQYGAWGLRTARVDFEALYKAFP